VQTISLVYNPALILGGDVLMELRRRLPPVSSVVGQRPATDRGTTLADRSASATTRLTGAHRRKRVARGRAHSPSPSARTGRVLGRPSASPRRRSASRRRASRRSEGGVGTSSASTNHRPPRDRCGASGPLLLRAGGRLKQEPDPRGCVGDEAAARSCRPGSAPSARLHAIARLRFVGCG
jgi:hypothetical protein